MYASGVVKGEEKRTQLAADLRRMREAFDELTRHEADLAEELLERAQEETSQAEATTRTKKGQAHR